MKLKKTKMKKDKEEESEEQQDARSIEKQTDDITKSDSQTKKVCMIQKMVS